MSHRSHRPAPERHARSRLVQLIGEQPFLPGSLVERARSCGKPTCRCQQGQRHRSLYLATRHQGRRALLYIPRVLEDTVRLWLPNGRSLSRQLQDLHQLQAVSGVGAEPLLLAAERESAMAGADGDAAGPGGGTAAEPGSGGTGGVVSAVGASVLSGGGGPG